MHWNKNKEHYYDFVKAITKLIIVKQNLGKSQKVYVYNRIIIIDLSIKIPKTQLKTLFLLFFNAQSNN